jgi:hypothetical protein
MDQEVRKQLQAAGISVERPELLQVAIPLHANGTPKRMGETVPVADERWVMKHVQLKPISQLWTKTGMTQLLFRPPPRHGSFLRLLQSTAAIYCVTVRRPETDVEFERLYRKLRRHPDGEDSNLLFSYLQAAASLYMSLRDVSQPEFESMTQHLSKLARRYSSHTGSTNYHHEVLYLAL